MKMVFIWGALNVEFYKLHAGNLDTLSFHQLSICKESFNKGYFEKESFHHNEIHKAENYEKLWPSKPPPSYQWFPLKDST